MLPVPNEGSPLRKAKASLQHTGKHEPADLTLSIDANWE